MERFVFVGLRAALFMLIAFLLAWCAPPAYISQKHARYDFQTEGFLSPRILQTIGRHESDPGQTRQACLEQALDQAVRRAVRVFLHTHFELPPRAGGSGLGAAAGSAFERSYPFEFTERDHIRGLLDFDSLLRRSFLALQDSRLSTECTVVLRLEGQDLPAEIRKMAVSFRPEHIGQRRFSSPNFGKRSTKDNIYGGTDENTNQINPGQNEGR